MEFSVKEFEVKGQRVGIRFGTRFFRLMQKEVKKNLSEILAMMAAGAYEFDFLATAFECAAKDYLITNGKEPNIKNDEMDDWIDAVGGAEGAVLIITNGITQYFPKNSKSLAETGEPVLQ